MSGRWKQIKSQKANLILFIAALILILLAPLWRLAVAPALKVVPTDIDLLRFYSGSLFTYVRPPGQPPVGAQPEKLGVTIQAREFSPPRQSTPTVAVIEVDSAVINSADRAHLADEKNAFAVNRKTAVQVKDSGSNRNRSAYYLVFPFNTPKKDLPIWDETTSKTQKGVYSGQEKVQGVNTYVFKIEYGGQVVPPPPGFPERMTGAQLKSVLSRPALPVADSAVIKVDYKANQSLKYLIEPEAGNLVATRNVQESVYMSVNDPSTGVTLTQVITKLDFAETPTSTTSAATFASDEIKKLRLQFVYIPVLYLILGIGILLVSLFAGTKE
jgi:hypothetical protein